MSRRAHYLKGNKGIELPVHCIFYDTETQSRRIDDDTEEAVLWFGWACYTRRYRDQTWGEPTWIRFRRAGEFWRFVGEYCKPKRKIYLFAHNTGFDFTVLRGFRWMRRFGWENTRRIVDDPPTVINFRKDGCTLCFIDTLNYFRMVLKDVGEFVGVDKLDMPASDANVSMWDDYCGGDVAVLVAAMQSYWRMVSTWELGNFAYTLPAQAFAAFRHRFMNTPIFIDDNEEASELARRGYVGARTECFQLGQIREKVICLDINSQYPFIMATTSVPTKLITTLMRTDMAELASLLESYCVVADVILNTNSSNYPKKIPGWTIFPVGQFQTVLNTPELKRALKEDAISQVNRLIVYEKAVIFKEYVDFFYTKRLEAKANNDLVLSTLCKLMMNSLYGKFGQNGRKFEHKWKVNNDAIRVWIEWDADRRTLHKYRQFAGVVEELQREAESRESFPAIAGHITSAGRLLLLDFIIQAGEANVVYCDTDSLFVTERGYNRLRDRIDETKLGELKHEWESDDVTIHGVKDYQVGDKLKRKGVRVAAIDLGNATFKQAQFRGFKGMIQAGDLDHLEITQVTKHLTREYRKGWVDPTGKVHPLRFPHPDFPDP